MTQEPEVLRRAREAVRLGGRKVSDALAMLQISSTNREITVKQGALGMAMRSMQRHLERATGEDWSWLEEDWVNLMEEAQLTVMPGGKVVDNRQVYADIVRASALQEAAEAQKGTPLV